MIKRGENKNKVCYNFQSARYIIENLSMTDNRCLIMLVALFTSGQGKIYQGYAFRREPEIARNVRSTWKTRLI